MTSHLKIDLPDKKQDLKTRKAFPIRVFCFRKSEETLKVRPLYGKRKKTTHLYPRVRYQAFAVAGDNDGFYGYAEAIKKTDKQAERTARSKATLRWRQLHLGSALLRNPRTLAHETRGRNGGITIIMRPAPTSVGINGPPMVRKVLNLIGIHDCLVRVKGNTRNGVNLARALNDALCRY